MRLIRKHTIKRYEKRKELYNQWKTILAQASFTVEAAMIMGTVLFVIMAVLYSAQTVYNRVLITAQVYEDAITGREHEVTGLWGQNDYDISINLEKLYPVSFLRKSQFITEE